MSSRRRVAAAVILQNRQVLITQRHPDDEMGGKWEFPGGTIEAGESPETCLQRELREELGLDVAIHEQMAVVHHRYPEWEIELLAWRCSIRSGTVRLYVHQDCRWVAPEELELFDFLEADKPIIAILEKIPGMEFWACHEKDPVEKNLPEYPCPGTL
ncbi:hypothetical protein CSB45_02695 [candidate division KSB3 bacterium]|uniref:8-oxo-dGTP diphosphatase n=1 Tax=candidate division KSB3 bacterium TaxID=2044937 RepID=A0A2G6EA17_9BACT|nr:MAG: hypothetical protein CSB45_02695 [candidate division KSB3 bacterium]PIE30987.1 MAG: hypothetical protein CSA57_01310 [candidate division KSB3 bacterium]